MSYKVTRAERKKGILAMQMEDGQVGIVTFSGDPDHVGMLVIRSGDRLQAVGRRTPVWYGLSDEDGWDNLWVELLHPGDLIKV